MVTYVPWVYCGCDKIDYYTKVPWVYCGCDRIDYYTSYEVN